MAEKEPAKQTISYSDEELTALKNDCLAGLEERRKKYDDYGEKILRNSVKNPLFKHLKDIASLVYYPDNIIFDNVIQIDKENIKSEHIKLFDKLKLEIYEDFVNRALDILIYDIVFWSLVYGSYFVKVFVNSNNEIVHKKVSPYDICVLYEDYQDLDKNQIILHVTRIPRHIAVKRYGEEAIVEMKEVSTPIRPETRFLQMVYSETKGQVPTQDEMWGIDTEMPPIPKTTGKYIEIYEMWLWDSDIQDYLMVQFIGNKVIKSKNPFIPKEHPFVPCIINSLEGYFFGLSELHFLYRIQDKLKEQIEKLNHNEQMLNEPPMIVSGLAGSIEAKEIREKLKKKGEIIEIIDPTGKIDFYMPKLTPDILYKSLEYWETSFKEMSGIIGILGGKPLPNVRSGSYASVLAQFASAPLREKALRVEYFIETLMSLHANIKTKILEKYALISGIPFRVDVFAHTSSPIVATFYQDMLLQLAEAGIIPPKVVIDVLPLPKKDEIIKFLETKAMVELVNETKKGTEKA